MACCMRSHSDWPHAPPHGFGEALARKAALVEFAEDPIIGLTLDGVITDWNPAAERLFGYSVAEAVGASIVMLLGPEHRGESGFLRRVRAGEVIRQVQTQGMAKDGGPLDVSISMSPIRDVDGTIVGAAAFTRDIGTTLQGEERVRRSEAQMADAQRIAVVGSWEWQIAGDTIDWSNEQCRIYGVDAGEQHNFETFLQAVHADDRPRVEASVQEAFATGAPFCFEHRLVRPDGSEREMLARGEVIVGPDGAPVTMRGTGQDITERKRTESALATSEQQLERNLRQQTAVAHLGRQALEGEDLRDLVDDAVGVLRRVLEREVAATIPPAVDGRCVEIGPLHLDAIGIAIGCSEVPFGELRVERLPALSCDELLFCEASANILADAITRLRAEEDTRHRALHDPLTGLPNRVLFLDRLTVALSQSHRRELVAVLFLDLDHFKLINDSRGHSAGDELLQSLAARLRSVMRPGDTLARFGGDEFCIVCGGIANEDEAGRIAQRVLQELSLPFSLTTGRHFVSASIGISLATGTSRPAEDLIREADAAMYRAKEGGRGRVELFDEVMRKNATHRLRIDNDLRRALEEDPDEFVAHYQPIVSMADGAVVGVEALVRWEHPQRGLLAPQEFISIAEDSGAIVALGDHVLRLACLQAAGWICALGDRALSVSVNLAPRQVARTGLADRVGEILDECGLDPGRLHLEITERSLIEESDVTIRNLLDLDAIGVRLVLDDFGTGYSSLAYLRRFPIAAIKIDRRFIAGLGRNADDTTIVEAILRMAAGLRIEVVAEGVETVHQRTILKQMGCRIGQGYLWSRPVPASDIDVLLGLGDPGKRHDERTTSTASARA
jgi:diguanylate cyclase (GGDEF)-like protein/PAS domain S-box-containing protein